MIGSPARRARRAAGEHLARRDAEPHPGRDAVLALELLAERGARLAQLERRAHGAQRVVLVQRAAARTRRRPRRRRRLDRRRRGARATPAQARRKRSSTRVQRLRVEPLGERRRRRRGRRPATVTSAPRVRGEAARPAAGAAAAGCDRGAGSRRGERRVVREHRAARAAAGARPARSPSSLDQRASRVLVGLQRVGLAVAAVQREHQLAAQPLAVRVLADQRLQPADHLGVAAERELRLDELLARGDPQLLEPGDLGLRERLVGEVGQRRAAPERERALERGGGRRRAARGELAPALARAAARSGAASSCSGLDGQRVAVLPRGERAARRPRAPCAGARPARGASAARSAAPRSPHSSSTSGPRAAPRWRGGAGARAAPAAGSRRARPRGPRRGPRAGRGCGTPCGSRRRSWATLPARRAAPATRRLTHGGTAWEARRRPRPRTRHGSARHAQGFELPLHAAGARRAAPPLDDATLAAARRSG